MPAPRILLPALLAGAAPATLAAYHKADYEKWGKVIAKANIKANIKAN